ncbi:hypothetical protein D9613_002806 [Agrocybe pediades]|uniref:NADH-ubiquinone oxidoreductase B15 subunit n=1 Tax=Agrocybe pediades TaxID=84607 RepID=A0A8H4QR33_9AGAR|nr:hypothetical protein D9613_002806 [Agrocybe pediades]KAF9562136.1 hypothetical protein CPC08DRAFT_706857 [Agrocybe pediades]
MGHGPVKTDPAIERFNTMREQAYLNFRWTRRTIRTGILGFIVVPAAVYYIADKYEMRWDFSGRLKGEPLTIDSNKS